MTQIGRVIQRCSGKMSEEAGLNRKVVFRQSKVKKYELDFKRLFDEFVESSPIPTFIINKTHNIIYWNREMEKLTGLKACEMLGTNRHWMPFFSAPTRLVADMAVDCISRKNIAKEMAGRGKTILKKNSKKEISGISYLGDYAGRHKWFSFIVRPFYDMRGRVAGAIETVENITERKLIKDKLNNRIRELQALYLVTSRMHMEIPLKKVFSNITKDILLICDEIKLAKSRIIYDGKVYTSLKPGEEFLCKIEEPLIVFGKKRGSIELGYSGKTEYPGSEELGFERNVLHIVAQSASKHCRSREVIGIYGKLVKKSVLGIFILQDKKFTFANPKFFRKMKYSGEELIGLPYDAVFPNCAYFKNLINNLNAGNSGCTVKALRKDGKTMFIEVYIQKIDYHGAPALLGTMKDVTSLISAQEKLRGFNKELKRQITKKTRDLRRANKALQSLNRDKDEFVAVTSHELRSPLTSIRGYLSFLVDDDTLKMMPSEARSYLCRVYDNVELFNNLINNILDVSRIEMDRMELFKRKADLITFLSDITANFMFQAKEKGIRMNFMNRLERESFFMKIDEIRLRQVFRNLLDNALKYSQKGGNIDVILEQHNNILKIVISDSGVGISKAELSDIFEKFSKGSNKRARYRGGAGLGLYIARKIVEMHGGKIWAESIVGKGTDIILTFNIQ